MKAKQRTLIVLLVFVLAAGAALALLNHANQKNRPPARPRTAASRCWMGPPPRWKASPSSMAARR